MVSVTLIGITLTAILFVATVRSPKAGLGMVALLLPFTFSLNPYPGYDLQALRLLVPAFCFAVALKNGAEFGRALRHPAVLFIFLFAVLATLSLALSPVPSWGIRKALYLWSLIPFLPASLAVTRAHGDGWTTPLLVGGVAVSVLGIIQWVAQFVVGTEALFGVFGALTPAIHGNSFGSLVLSHPSWFVDIGGVSYLRAFALFPDPHIFAFYINIILIVVLTRLAFVRSGAQFVWYSVIYAVCAMALIFTFSRGGYAGLLAGHAAWFWWMRGRLSRRHRAAAGLLIAAGATLFIIGQPVVSRFVSSFDVTEGSNAGRLVLWGEALRVFSDHPLGVGLGGYAAAIDATVGSRNPITAHDFYLDILTETGFGGFLVLTAFIGWLVGSILARRHTLSPSHSLIAAGALAGFSAHAVFEDPLYAPAVFVLVLGIIALLSCPRAPEVVAA